MFEDVEQGAAGISLMPLTSRGSWQGIDWKYAISSSLQGPELNRDPNFEDYKLKLEFSFLVDLLAIQALGTFCAPGGLSFTETYMPVKSTKADKGEEGWPSKQQKDKFPTCHW